MYTVKPPSKEGTKYRRKARNVGCGNFQPRDAAEENYSGGAAAEAVRLGVTQAAKRKWGSLHGRCGECFLASTGTRGYPSGVASSVGACESRVSRPNGSVVGTHGFVWFSNQPSLVGHLSNPNYEAGANDHRVDFRAGHSRPRSMASDGFLRQGRRTCHRLRVTTSS